MKLKQALIKLPVRFCAETLAAEVRALPPEAWVPHPRRFAGNEAVPLVTPDGENTDDFLGPMAPTQFLRQSPYIMQVMSALGAVWGRSRLMGLGAGADVPAHIDTKYYWRTHTRVHVPIITNPDVSFTCGGETVHMQAGDCWVLDTFREHHVHNGGRDQRVHLVLDTVGGQHLWDLIERAQSGHSAPEEPLFVPPGGPAGPLRYERHQVPRIMSPWELKGHLEEMLGLAEEHPLLDQVRLSLDRLLVGWFGTWAEHADDDSGLPHYRYLVDEARRDLDRIGATDLRISNGFALYRLLEVILLGSAVAPDDVRKTIDRKRAA